MLKRARWLATGVALGAGGTIWAKRRLGELQDKVEPVRIAGGVAEAAAGRVKAAVGVGRAQAQRRESEIRRNLEGKSLENRSVHGRSGQGEALAAEAPQRGASKGEP